MAFSAHSLSNINGNGHLDVAALQHYQQALPALQASLRIESDLASDGVFLTHFVLLMYEVSCGGPNGLSLWQQQVSQLLNIVLLRRRLYGNEPYQFILWWVASIDTHVVLFGMDKGNFIETMLQHNLLSSDHNTSNDRRLVSSTSEHQSTFNSVQPSALSFHRRLCIFGAEIGLLARDLRAEEKEKSHGRSFSTMRSRQERIGRLQDQMRAIWNAQASISIAEGYSNDILPVGARSIFEHVS